MQRRSFYILGIIVATAGILFVIGGWQYGIVLDGLGGTLLIVAAALFLIGRLFPAPADTAAPPPANSAPDPPAVRVEHTKKHSALEKMAWLATIAAAIVALLAYLGGR